MNGHGVNRWCVCNFLLVINSNLDVSPTVLEILTYLVFHSGGTPCDINVIYTPLKIAFNGLQFGRCQYGSIFIRLAVVGYNSAKSRDIPTTREFELMIDSQGHPRSLILVSIESAYAISY